MTHTFASVTSRRLSSHLCRRLCCPRHLQRARRCFAAGGNGAFDVSDVSAFTESILLWWRTNGRSFPKWAEAARIAFALSPNSAACERVFSQLKLMFGDLQANSLGDYIRSALMLRFNKRSVG